MAHIFASALLHQGKCSHEYALLALCDLFISSQLRENPMSDGKRCGKKNPLLAKKRSQSTYSMYSRMHEILRPQSFSTRLFFFFLEREKWEKITGYMCHRDEICNLASNIFLKKRLFPKTARIHVGTSFGSHAHFFALSLVPAIGSLGPSHVLGTHWIE